MVVSSDRANPDPMAANSAEYGVAYLALRYLAGTFASMTAWVTVSTVVPAWAMYVARRAS